MGKKITLVSFLFFTITLSFSQTRTLTGTVLDDMGESVIGAVVNIEGTSNSALTDIDGSFSLTYDESELNAGSAFLVIRYIGYEDKRVEIGDENNLQITLDGGDNFIDEVVVTAMGIQKERKALGYSVGEVTSDQVNNKPVTNVARSIQGKVPGVQISTTNGETGSEANVRIRSALSVTQSNDPLIIVNNVPFEGNLSDIDANDIKDISILKGLNASILYGSEGRNGVILVVTKSGDVEFGEKRTKTTFSNTTYMNQIAAIPEYQNKYGQGSDFNFAGGNLGTWGPAFTDLEEVPHPYSGQPNVFPQFDGVMVPYEAKPNNVEDFFRTGLGSSSALNFSSTNESTAFNISAGFVTEKGIIGNNDLKRYNVSMGGKLKVSERLNLSSTFQFSNRKANRLQSTELFSLLLFIPRNVDVYNLPYQDPVTGASAYYRSSQNPLWVMNNTGKEDDIIRLFGTLKADFKINETFNLAYRLGLDNDNEDEFDYSNRGGFGDNEFGNLTLDLDKGRTIDQTLLLGVNEIEIGENFYFDAQTGLNSKYQSGHSSFTTSVDQNVFGFLRPNNFNVTESLYSTYQENLAGLFGQFGFNYNDYLYLTLSGRNDWGSTVEKENRSLFYPGVSFSFIPTEIMNLGSDKLNYLKIRGAYATSSGYPGRYLTRATLETNPRRFVTNNGQVIISNSTDEFFANPDLKPELHQEVEFGLEGVFFDDRARLELSTFKRISKDQILRAARPPASGYTSTIINAGQIDTKGLEIDLGVDLIRKDEMNWNFRNLFTSYESTVVDLPQEQIALSGTDNGFAIEGQPLGVLKGSYALRDGNGNFLINPDNGELYISDEVGFADQVIGDPTPDFAWTTLNNFTYKDFFVNTQFEYIKGGRMFAPMVEDLMERGVTRDTENREGTFVLPGVYGDPATGEPLLDSNGNTIANNIQLNSNRTVFSNYYNADDLSSFDASVMRLRELSVGYRYVPDLEKNFPVKDVSLSLTGFNLWHRAPDFPKYVNFDPEADNGKGDQAVPPTKRLGLSLNATF